MAIAVQGGAVGLAEVHAWIDAQPDPGLMRDGDTLRVPLVILPGARLRLTPGETLILSRPDGAFVANFGTLAITGATVSGRGDSNPGVADFAPFVTTAGTGKTWVSGAVLEGLGFGAAEVYSGYAVINRGLYQPIGGSFLVSSLFRDTGRITIVSSPQTVVQDNVFVGSHGGGIVLRNTTDAKVTGNLFVDVRGGAALHVTDGASDSQITGNVVLNGDAAGLVIDRGSRDATIDNNLIWGNARGGISVVQSDCVWVVQNVSMNNGQKGIELRDSRGSTVAVKRIYGNGSAGLYIADQPTGTDTLVASNDFVGNRVGLASASPYKLTLQANDFRAQFPRFLDGDLVAQTFQIVQDLQGAEEIELFAGGIEASDQSPVTCTSGGDG